MFRKIIPFCLGLFAALPVAAQSISLHFEKHSDSC